MIYGIKCKFFLGTGEADDFQATNKQRVKIDIQRKFVVVYFQNGSCIVDAARLIIIPHKGSIKSKRKSCSHPKLEVDYVPIHNLVAAPK